eukprot:2342918-Ditylum_brightwellii.AAC.1
MINYDTKRSQILQQFPRHPSNICSNQSSLLKRNAKQSPIQHLLIPYSGNICLGTQQALEVKRKAVPKKNRCDSDDKPGKRTSTDQLVSNQPGLVPQ